MHCANLNTFKNEEYKKRPCLFSLVEPTPLHPEQQQSKKQRGGTRSAAYKHLVAPDQSIRCEERPSLTLHRISGQIYSYGQLFTPDRIAISDICRIPFDATNHASSKLSATTQAPQAALSTLTRKGRQLRTVRSMSDFCSRWAAMLFCGSGLGESASEPDATRHGFRRCANFPTHLTGTSDPRGLERKSQGSSCASVYLTMTRLVVGVMASVMATCNSGP
ncbi:hypothetical protein B0J12DRAFT_705382 [Macrophomina phaseolina]|uniref:Uncharacterized protein n=1 Tax=Macrophomina phaseolina TaxID=35725 RepID=A0ABQ8FSA9_9PEZI|nr:hypothetical protein B0J12DRAFT_705382 [Macrophomina phaseolina]